VALVRASGFPDGRMALGGNLRGGDWRRRTGVLDSPREAPAEGAPRE
jgi:hypothetical protein